MAAAAGAGAGPAAAQVVVPPSTTVAGAQFLQPNVNFVSPPASTFETSQEVGYECPTGGPTSDRSFWFKVRGTGGRLTFTTAFSSTGPDTIIFTYGPNTVPPAGVGPCNDDVGSDPHAQVTIEQSVAGATYYVSYGVCRYPGGGAYCGASDGPVNFAVIANDQRAFADALVNESRTNVGATTEAGEVLSCNGVGYAQTVWYRYVAPAKGRVTLAASSSSTDPVTALYRNDSATPSDCNDNSASNPLRSEIGAEVARGEVLLLQIGTKPASTGGLNLSVDFVEDTDVDDDGFPRGPDCNDGNGAVRPGAPEIPNNDVDENCDGALAFDRDGDGVIAGPDCDDANPGIRPGARDIPGDGINQDCAAGSAPLLRLNGVIDITGGTRGAITTIRSFYATRLGAGSRVELRCKGRWCKRPAARFIRFTKARTRLDVIRYLRSRRVPAGVVLELRVTRKEHRGEALRVTMRSRRGPAKKRLCAAPGRAFRSC